MGIRFRVSCRTCILQGEKEGLLGKFDDIALAQSVKRKHKYAKGETHVVVIAREQIKDE